MDKDLITEITSVKDLNILCDTIGFNKCFTEAYHKTLKMTEEIQCNLPILEGRQWTPLLKHRLRDDEYILHLTEICKSEIVSVKSLKQGDILMPAIFVEGEPVVVVRVCFDVDILKCQMDGSVFTTNELLISHVNFEVCNAQFNWKLCIPNNQPLESKESSMKDEPKVKLALGKNWELYGYRRRPDDYTLVFNLPTCSENITLGSESLETLVEAFKDTYKVFLRRPHVNSGHWSEAALLCARTAILYDRDNISFNDGIISLSLKKCELTRIVDIKVEILSDDYALALLAEEGHSVIGNTSDLGKCALEIGLLQNLIVSTATKVYTRYLQTCESVQCILDGLLLYKGASSAM